MDRQLIKALIDALEASALTELEYSRDGETLRLSKGGGASSAARSVAAAAPRVERMPAVVAPGGAVENVVVAALYGIVHLQRTPGAAPFVTVGQDVQAGQVVCMIEAMKVFTDMAAEQAGTVVEILVGNGQEVEAGQPLVRLG